MIHDARSVLATGKAPTEWALHRGERRPPIVLTVAPANKMASAIWTLLAHDHAYWANFIGQPP